jgi:hypothetical protein
MSTQTPTRREKRLAARDDRKRRASAAQKRAQMVRTIGLIGGGIIFLGAMYLAYATEFFGLATPSVGRVVAIEKADHVPEGTKVTYASRPPSSGAHFGSWYPSYGVFEDDIPPELWVHNLEHGAVVMLFNCPQGCPDVVAQAKELMLELPKVRNVKRGLPRLLVVPYKEMDAKIAMVSWGYVLELNEFDKDKLKRFFEARVDRGPECQNLACPE